MLQFLGHPACSVEIWAMSTYVLYTYGEYGPEEMLGTNDRGKLVEVYTELCKRANMMPDDMEIGLLRQFMLSDDKDASLSVGWGGFQVVEVETI